MASISTTISSAARSSVATARPTARCESVEHFPGSDMLVVRGAMVPMVRAIVAEIDLPGKRIVIDPPEGLLETLVAEG